MKIKKLTSLAMALAMTAAAIPPYASAVEVSVDTAYDTVLSDGLRGADEEKISGYFRYIANSPRVYITGITSDAPDEITVPAEIDGLPVTDIKEYAFRNKTNLKKVTLPDTVKWIGISAFENCTSLESMNIPAGVTTIVDSAFNGTYAMKEFTVDSNNKNFSSSDGMIFSKDGKTLCFYPMGRTDEEFNIPEGVETVEVGAMGSHYLKRITIPASVTSFNYDRVHYSADDVYYEEMPDLEEIVVAPGNNSYSSYKGLLLSWNGTKLLFAPLAITSADFPEKVTTIPGLAFKDHTKLTEVTFHEGMTSIGTHAFSGCSALTSIVLPSTMNTIENEAFNYCESLTDITIKNKATKQFLTPIFANSEPTMTSSGSLVGSLFKGRIHIFENSELIQCNYFNLGIAQKLFDVEIDYLEGDSTPFEGGFKFDYSDPKWEFCGEDIGEPEYKPNLTITSVVLDDEALAGGNEITVPMPLDGFYNALVGCHVYYDSRLTFVKATGVRDNKIPTSTAKSDIPGMDCIAPIGSVSIQAGNSFPSKLVFKLPDD